YAQIVASDVRLVIAGTPEGICMVEGSAKELLEKDFLDILFKAHEEIKKLVAWQETIRAELGKTKNAVTDVYGWYSWRQKIDDFLTQERVAKAYIQDKVERNEYFSALRKEFDLQYAQDIVATLIPSAIVEYIFDSVFKE